MSGDVGRLILRLVLGGCVLLHGIAKIIGGVGGIAGMLTAAGLPAFFAYGAYVGEVIGPILLIIGWYSRIGAALIVLNMLFAIGLAHSAEVFTLTKQGGWALELQGMFLFVSVALMLLGPGRFGINQR